MTTPDFLAPALRKFTTSIVLTLCFAHLANAQTDQLGQQGQAAEPSPAVPQQNLQQGPTALPSITSRPEQRRYPSAVATRPGKSSLEVKGEFESYAETVSGRTLPVFGKNFFSDVPSTFSPVDGAQVNADYIIGPGDELQIRGWGMIDVNVSPMVDRSGSIYIPRVGSIRVAGVRYGDLQGYLKAAVGRIFSNFELSVSVSQTRAVQIYVVGHAVRPGTYTLNSMSTLLNALFTSGGPDANGSMRNIQVKRGSQVVTTFDLYDMLVNGDKSKDVALRDGDVIFIPQVGSQVAIAGNVKQPGIFELKQQSSLADLVRWAGGFDSAAENKRVVIERSVENRFNTVAELNASATSIEASLSPLPVNPADIVRVFAPGATPVQAIVKNEYVRISGEVQKSGVFQIRPGETLRDLVIRLGGPTENGFLFATQFTRDSVRRQQQTKLNEVADRFDRDLESATNERLAGTVDKENAAFVSADIERQRGIARRLRDIKAEGRISLEFPDGNVQVKNLPDIALQDGDTIFVPRRPGTIDVVGAVFAPNSFIYRGNRNVGDYVTLAGGITRNADKSEMYVLRADGTARSAASTSWFTGINGYQVTLGDTIVIPEKIERRSWLQNFKEWTAIFYQFGLGAAGLKVLQN